LSFVNVADARLLARRRLPRIFFDYIDGGASAEATLRANEADFDRHGLRQRVLVDVRDRDVSANFLGRTHALPFVLGPVGFTGLFWPAGEIAAATAAARAGIGFSLSHFAIATLADIRTRSTGPLYAQLYALKDRAMIEALVEQAERQGADALILTVDTAVTGIRERDDRNGFRSLDRLTPGLALRLARKPRWCMQMLAAGMPQVGVARGRPEFGRGVLAQARSLARLIDPGLTWADLGWLRARWPGWLAVKGILCADDARRAVAAGADAVIVSNHGGRQLDGASSTVAVLPEIAAAVGHEVEVLLDGGIRRGTHVAKALALGANGVLLGRAYAYGLAAAGEAGVARVIEAIGAELSVTMALMGVASVAELRAGGRDLLRPQRRGDATLF